MSRRLFSISSKEEILNKFRKFVKLGYDELNKTIGENFNFDMIVEKMKQINGGAITSAMINAISKAVNALYELGTATGSALRRIIRNKYCALR